MHLPYRYTVTLKICIISHAVLSLQIESNINTFIFSHHKSENFFLVVEKDLEVIL